MSILQFGIKATSENDTKLVVEARGFKLIIDEPQNLGGTDAGPNPVEYLLASLAGCLNVVGHIVAKELGFDLYGLSFELEGDLDPARFTGAKTNERAGYKEIRVKIIPDTRADTATLQEWLKIVESRCPVSDNIGNTTPLKLELQEA